MQDTDFVSTACVKRRNNLENLLDVKVVNVMPTSCVECVDVVPVAG